MCTTCAQVLLSHISTVEQVFDTHSPTGHLARVKLTFGTVINASPFYLLNGLGWSLQLDSSSCAIIVINSSKK